MIDWNEDHKERLRAFLNTPTGAMLQDVLVDAIHQRNASAIRAAGDRDFENGRALGFHEGLMYLDELSKPAKPEASPASKQEGEQGGASLEDQLRP
jgi:hypothetical protein